MAPIPQGRVMVFTVLGFLACLSGGCVGLNDQLTHGTPAPADMPCEVGVRWQPEVAFAPDPLPGGHPTQGLVGRIYLFNSKFIPVVGDGCLHVELSDAGVDPPKELEQWNFPAAELAKFQRKDAIGPGYSIFLPWFTYSKDVTKVVMKVGYQPNKAMPIYAAPTTLLLECSSKFPMSSR